MMLTKWQLGKGAFGLEMLWQERIHRYLSADFDTVQITGAHLLYIEIFLYQVWHFLFIELRSNSANLPPVSAYRWVI